MKKKRKVWPWILSACLVTFLAVVFVTKFGGQASESTELASWRADYGTVIRSITSSGKLRSADTIGVEAEELEIESITVSVGDPVQAGDVLALYDADSIQEKENVLLIPMEAIHEDESGLFVLVQAGEGTERREIRTGISDGVSVEVTDGLVQGETIRYQAAAVVNEYPFGPPPFMN